MPTPASLRIVTYGPGRGFYLLYYDVDGKEMTDTFHDSIEQAMDQANFEFTIDASEWERPDTEPVG